MAKKKKLGRPRKYPLGSKHVHFDCDQRLWDRMESSRKKESLDRAAFCVRGVEELIKHFDKINKMFERQGNETKC